MAKLVHSEENEPVELVLARLDWNRALNAIVANETGPAMRRALDRANSAFMRFYEIQVKIDGRMAE